MYEERLAARLDGGRWIKYDPNGYVLAWYGSHGLHVYDLTGREIDYVSVGDFSLHSATLMEIQEAANSWSMGTSA